MSSLPARAHLSSASPSSVEDGDLPATSVDFAGVCREVSNQARRTGLKVPSFRSPPRIVGLSRTVRRRPDGAASVAIAFRNRPWGAVIADIIEGVVIANDLTGVAAARARDDLWEAVSFDSNNIAA